MQAAMDRQIPIDDQIDAKSFVSKRYRKTQEASALWFCTQESLSLVERDEDTYFLLLLLGCLPVGVTRQNLLDLTRDAQMSEEIVTKCL